MAKDEVPISTRTLPGSYSEMYPGRFLKADALKGKKVMITVSAIQDERLVGENNKHKDEWIVSIKERPLQLVLNKTNAFCLYRMFGSDPHGWLGKRIVIYPTTTKFGKSDVDCIRVWGSPDIPEDMEITVPQGRKKAWETVMHKMTVAGSKEQAATPPAQATSEPASDQVPAAASELAVVPEKVVQVFDLLGWSRTKRELWVSANLSLSPEQMLGALEPLLDSE